MEELGGGLNNLIYRDKGFVYRKKLDSDPDFFSAINERKTYALGEGDIFPRVYRYEDNGDYVEEYIDGRKFLSAPTAGQLEKLGRTIRKLHGYKSGDIGGFYAVRRLKYYENHAEGPYLDKGKVDAAVSVFESLLAKYGTRPCHNDLVEGNVLETPGGRIVLLDLEFAGTNLPLFDLNSVLSENGIEDPDLSKALLTGYFGRTPSKEETSEVLSLSPFLDALWYYWALLRYKATGNSAFLAIAMDKVKAFGIHSESAPVL